MSAGDKRATVRQTAKAERRRAILEHAKLLFAAHGFRAVSIEEIGAGAGVSGPAVYRHFASKEDILAELLVGISDYLHQGGARIVGGTRVVDGARVVGGGDPPEVKLRRLVDFHLDFALAEPDLIRIQDRDFTALPAEARSRVRRLQRQYVSAWARPLQDFSPTLSPDAATVTVHAVFGMVNSTPYVARRFDPAVVADRLRAAALAALGVEGSSCSVPRDC